MSTPTRIGKVSVTPRGTWSSSRAYEKLDIVEDISGSYIAITTVPAGTPLNDSTKWMVLMSHMGLYRDAQGYLCQI